jgi:hypothetical protein
MRRWCESLGIRLEGNYRIWRGSSTRKRLHTFSASTFDKHTSYYNSIIWRSSYSRNRWIVRICHIVAQSFGSIGRPSPFHGHRVRQRKLQTSNSESTAIYLLQLQTALHRLSHISLTLRNQHTLNCKPLSNPQLGTEPITMAFHFLSLTAKSCV